VRFAPLRQHDKGRLGYPPCGGWRAFRARPGHLQGISPSWRLFGPPLSSAMFQTDTAPGFPFRALLRWPSDRPFRASSLPALSSAACRPCGRGKRRTSATRSGSWPAALRLRTAVTPPRAATALLGFGPLRYSLFPPCARGGGPSSWLLPGARTEARTPPAVESVGNGKMSWTLASLLTPLVFLASFVKTEPFSNGPPRDYRFSETAPAHHCAWRCLLGTRSVTC
jgi:hypothetical protein